MIGDENIDVVELPTMWKAMQKRFLSPGKKWWEQFIGCSQMEILAIKSSTQEKIEAA